MKLAFSIVFFLGMGSSFALAQNQTNPTVYLPKITMDLQNITCTAGQSISLQVAAKPAGSGDSLSYRWLKNGFYILFYLGAIQTDHLSFTSVSTSDQGTYKVEISEDGFSSFSTSSEAVLTVNRGTQQVNFPPIPTQVLPAQPILLPAASNVGIRLDYTIQGPAAVISNGTGRFLQLTGTGTVTVHATNNGSLDYLPVDVAQTFTVTGPSSLQVNITPPEAVAAGAEWQFDGGAWMATGALAPVGAGIHKVHFNQIAGWASPSDQFVNVSAGSTAAVNGNFVRLGTSIDFNGDTLTDLVLEDNAGSVGFWSMSMQTLVANSYFNPGQSGSPDWKIVGVGDFDQNAQPDLLFQHTDGTLAVWFMNGTNLTSVAFLDPSSTGSKDWRVVATGDFDKNGQIDILFQHADGTLAVWYMSGIHLVQATYLVPSAPSDTRWRAVGLGDVDGDGNLDIIFQHQDGTLAVWYLHSLQLDKAGPLNPDWPGDANLRVVAVTDLDHNGSPDVLFQNRSTQELGVWFMKGANLLSGMLLSPANPGGTWKLVAP